eukprot:6543479-Ditylum_brightwellii.AAC.1
MGDLSEKKIDCFEKARDIVSKGSDMTLEEKTGTLSNISKCSAELQWECIITFNHCPFTVSIQEGNKEYRLQAPSVCTKRSKAYGEFWGTVVRKNG